MAKPPIVAAIKTAITVMAVGRTLSPGSKWPTIAGPRIIATETSSATFPAASFILHRAIYWAVGSGVATCVLMIMGFATAYFGFRHEPGAALLFTVSLTLFTVSLIAFAREISIALKQPEAFDCTSAEQTRNRYTRSKADVR